MSDRPALSHDDLAPNAAAYALGALDPVERAEFEAHLATCDECRAAVDAYRRVTAGLALATEPVAPPPALRAKVLANATAVSSAAPVQVPRVARRTPTTYWPGLLAAASLLLVAIGAYAYYLHTEVRALRQSEALASARAERLRQDLASARQDTARLARALDVMSAADALTVDLAGTAGAPSARGRAFFSPTRGLFMSAYQLPALRAGRIYQLWLVLPNQAPLSAGLLQVDANGSGSLTDRAAGAPAIPRSTVVTFAITDEPAAGSAGPTTPILLAGSKKTE